MLHVAVSVIVSPFVAVAVAIEASAANVPQLVLSPLVHAQPAKLCPDLEYVFAGAVQDVSPYVQLVGVVGAVPEPPPASYDMLNVFTSQDHDVVKVL